MSDVQSRPRKPPPHDSFAPLRVPGFRWFVVSVLTMAMGAQIQGVVVAWQMYAITHNPLSLGMVGLAEAVPFVGLALWAGHVADSLDRRRVALIALVVLFLCALALAVINRPGAGGALESQSLRLAIYGVIVICGAARSFLLPARNALSAEVVPRALYSSSVAWRTGVWQVAAVTGPALGGLIYGWVGAGVAYSSRRRSWRRRSGRSSRSACASGRRARRSCRWRAACARVCSSSFSAACSWAR